MKRFYRFGFWIFVFTAVMAISAPVRAEESSNDLEKTLGLKFFGDFRFRFTYMTQGQDYAPTHDSSIPLWIDHELNYRIRAKFGAEKSFGEDTKLCLAFISTGDGDPSDPYWTLSGAGSFKQVGLDLAYLAWMPSFLDRVISVSAGKFPNPLAYSPITWNEDVTPEGLAFNIEPSKDTKFTLLYFRVVDNGPALIEGAGADPLMADLQIQQKFHCLDAEVSLTAGYQYISNTASFETGDAGVTNYMSNPSNPPGAPLSITSKGMVGDLTAGNQIPEMHVVEGLLNISHTIGEEKIPVLWTFHTALNLSSFTINALTNANVAVNNPGLKDTNDLALFAGVKVGKVAHWNDWAGELEWGYIEPDAVFSAFNDVNPGLGHNNNTWFKGQVEMGLGDGLDLCVAQYLDWRTDYDVFATTPSNVFGTTSRAPMLRTLVDVTAKL